MPVAAGSEAAKLRVAKKLSTTSRGAIKLSRQFGDAMVCVRHRIDSRNEFRYTTVELLVEKVRIVARPDTMVRVRIDASEFGLVRIVRAAGATFEVRTRTWRLHRRTARALGLADRIILP